jgi:hypothetical protein
MRRAHVTDVELASTADLPPVIRTIDVARSAADTFRIFTAETFAWWPHPAHTRARTALGERTVAITIEPRVGGRIYESVSTGEEIDWGEVTAFQPPTRFAMRFWMGFPREQGGDVEVHFEPLGTERCRVTLSHTGWERFGTEANAVRNRFVPGWTAVFDKAFGTYAGV